MNTNNIFVCILCSIFLIAPCATSVIVPIPQFKRYDFLVSTHPDGVVIADLNSDGKNDFVVGGDTHINVYIWKSQTNFVCKNYSTFAKFSVLAVGDLNGDNRNDIVGAHGGGVLGYPYQKEFSLYIQKSNGEYTNEIKYKFAEKSSRAIAMGDINNDNKNEVVVADEKIPGGEHIYVYGWDSGTANLTLLKKYPVSSSTTAIAIGDVNTDGKNDVVTSGFDGYIHVFIQNPDGGLKPEVTYKATTQSGLEGVAIGDLNGDGRNDVAVSTAHDHGVSVFLQNAQGGLNPKIGYMVGDYTEDIVIKDLDADGKPEIVVARLDDAQVELLRFNTTTNKIESIAKYKTGNWTNELDVGDANNDGCLDILCSNWKDNTSSLLVQIPIFEFFTFLLPISVVCAVFIVYKFKKK